MYKTQVIDKVNDKSPVDKDGLTPLHTAAKHSNVEVFRFIMENSTDKNPVDNSGRTPLHHVARFNCTWDTYMSCEPQIEICQIIIENVTDKNPCSDVDKEGDTPLHYAANSFELYKFIMGKVKDKTPANNCGKTPLHKAVFNDNLEVCL